jgi:hypothetical protein
MGMDPPQKQPLPPPAPDVFDQTVRSARAAQTDQELAAKGRRRTLLTAPLGASGAPPTTNSSKTLLGQ